MTEGLLHTAQAGRRAQTKAANRAAILAAAREVFADLGYDGASVRDIVRRTGLAAGTFYNYFPDRESVLRALLEEIAGEVRERVRAARAAATTLEAFIADGFRAYFAYLAGEPQLFVLLRRNAGTIRALFDEPAVGGGTQQLAADLRAAVAGGLVPEHDTELMARAMVGAGFEVAVLMLEREPPDVEEAVAFVTSLFLGGLERLRDLSPASSRPSP